MSKDLEKKQSAEIAVPDYLKEYQGQGADDISSDLIIKSFLQVAHEEKGEIKFGEFYDSSTEESLGSEVVVTVCKIMKTWRKFTDDFQLETTSSDGRIWDNGEPLSEEEKWRCAFIDMFLYLNESPSAIPYIISFKSTSYKTGQKLATAIAKFTRGQGEAIFQRSYTLFSEEAKKGSKSYAVIRYKLNPGFNTKEVVLAAALMRKTCQSIQPVMETLIEDEPSIAIEADFD